MESLLQAYKCTQASDATHLSLIGGKFKIEDRHLKLFHHMYANTHTRGAYLVEKVKYPSRWYVDLDKITRNDIEEILIPRLRSFGQDCIVCIPLDTWDGAHIIFQNVCVSTKEDARKWSDQLLEKTSLVYDQSVYSSGLRMIGSKKKKDIDRIYSPFVYIKVNEQIRVEGIDADVLGMCSIHTQNLPGLGFANALIKSSVVAKTFTKRETCHDFSTSEVNIQSESIKLTSVKKGKHYFYLFTTETYCVNLKKHHKSATQFFEMDPKPKRMRRRCMCKCKDTGCSAFRGDWFRMPVKLYYDIIQNVTDTDKDSKWDFDTCDAIDSIHHTSDILDDLFG